MKTLDKSIKDLLFGGCVIPAHPLALDENRKLDEQRQRLLTRYYMASGAGGIAVGVHTTQFEIRNPEYYLYEKVLTLATEEVGKANLKRPFIKVAGVSGDTAQAVNEARIAARLGYDIALVSMNGMSDWTEDALIERTKEIGREIPLFGFYLQPAVGGRKLSFNFWKAFADIPNVYAIKMAPFNRYQTLDVVRAVCHSNRNNDIALYTGNDDNIVADLLTTYKIVVSGITVEKQIVGGLLGHWAVWTKKAVELLDEIKEIKSRKRGIPEEMLSRGIAITDSNEAFFDSANQFKGVIAGIHEVLKRQGILKGLWCLDPKENLSPGQSEEISRVYSDYPELNDDDFVETYLKEWMRDL